MTLPLPPGAEIAIIGAGVSGLATAKRLADEGFRPFIYDRRRHVGGLWNFSAQAQDPLSANVDTRFASAVYSDLSPNSPRHLLEFQDAPHDEDVPLFLTHRQIHQYLQKYSDTIAAQVTFCLEQDVVRLHFGEMQQQDEDVKQEKEGTWILTAQDVNSKQETTKRFAAVVVAAGMHDTEFVPPYEGLDEWQTRWKAHLMHSKHFRGHEPFIGKKVLLVGYGDSGGELAQRIVPHAAQLYISSRYYGDNYYKLQLPRGAIGKPVIARLQAKNRTVHFVDDSHVARLDYIIFCTGYQPPKLSSFFLTRKEQEAGGQVLAHHHHQHIVCAANPTLASVGCVLPPSVDSEGDPSDSAPAFALAQAQAGYLARVWAGRITLVKDEEQQQQQPPGFSYPVWMDYFLWLQKACETADDVGGMVTQTTTTPFQWTMQHEWVFRNNNKMRNAFFDLSEEQRKTVVRVEQLAGLEDVPPGLCFTLASRDVEWSVQYLVLKAAYFPDKLKELELLLDMFGGFAWHHGFPDQAFRELLPHTIEYWEEMLGPRAGALFRKTALGLMEMGLQNAKKACIDEGWNDGWHAEYIDHYLNIRDMQDIYDELNGNPLCHGHLGGGTIGICRCAREEDEDVFAM